MNYKHVFGPEAPKRLQGCYIEYVLLNGKIKPNLHLTAIMSKKEERYVKKVVSEFLSSQGIQSKVVFDDTRTKSSATEGSS